MDLTLPVTDPVGVFFILFAALFAAPILAELVRLPGLVGTVLAGMLLGPRGLGLIDAGAFLESLGGFGLLYIFFTAGLELDLRKLRRKSADAVVFGGLTFLIPLGLGYAAGILVFDLPVVPAILLGSLFASHTMLPYPIVQAMGLSGSRAVYASVGATTITDILAMLALALTTAGSGPGWEFWLKTVGILSAWTVGAALLLPPVISRFFRRIKSGGSSEFLFALAVAFFCSAAAALAGIEPAVGAFAAGILLNGHIPERSGLMSLLKFAGDALFIPLCVLYIGVLADARALFTDGRMAALAAVMLGVVLVSKYASSLFLKPLFGFSLGEVNISFGLSVNQTASTLAAALVGYRLGLLGEAVLNGTVVMFIVTCALGPFVTRKAATALAVETTRGQAGPGLTGERILIAVSNPGTLRPLTDFAFLMRDPKSPEPVLPVCVVQDSPNSDRDLEQAETVLAQAIAQGVAEGVPVKPSTRVSLNAAEGILQAAEEQEATTVLVGWNRPPRPSGAIFGDVIDQVVAGGRHLTVVARLRRPLPESPSLVLVAPPFAERNPGASRAYALMQRILGGVPAKLTVLTLASDSSGVRDSLRRIRGAAPHILELESWKEFPRAIAKQPEGTAFLFLCPRPGRLAWHPSLEQLPRNAAEAFPDSTLMVTYLPDEGWAAESYPAVPAEHPAASTVEETRPAPEAPMPAPHPAAVSEGPAGPSPDPSDLFYRTLVDSGRVIPDLPAAAVVDAVRILLERGFPGDRRSVTRLTGIYADIAQKQPIELAPGVLLLHAHVDNIEEPRILIGAKPAGLRLLALEEPIRIVVLLCAPSSQSPEDHLRTLSLIAQALKRPERAARILAAKTAEDLREGS